MPHQIQHPDHHPAVDAAPPHALVSALISAFRRSAVGLAIRTGSGRLIDANPAYCHMLGYARDELEALDLTALVHPEDLEPHAARIKEMASGALDVLQFEQRLCRKDGSVFWAMVTVTAIRDDDGRYLGLFALLQDITAQKQIEAHHREQEAHLATLVAHLPIALYSLDLGGDGEFPYVSPRFTQVTGLGRSELAGDLEKLLPVIHPDDHDVIWQADERSARTGEPFHVEFRLRGRDGDWRWVDNHSELIRDDAGNPHSWKGIILDVSERKRLEASLRESQTRFQRAFEDAAIGISLGAADDTCLDVNAAYCRILDRPREAIVGHAFAEFTHPDDVAAFAAQHERLRAGDIEAFTFEKRYLRPDGTLVTGLVTCSAVRNERGAFVYDIGQVQDISAQKAAAAALRESEQRLQTLVTHLPAAVYRQGAPGDTTGTFVSPSFATLLQIEPSRMPLGFAAFFERIHPDDRDAAVHAAAAAERHGAPMDIEYRLRRNDGEWIWVHDRSAIERGTNGQPGAWTGILIDITERKRLETALDEHEARLRSIVEQLPAAIYRFEPAPKSRFTFASSRFETMTGLSLASEGIALEEFFARIHPDDVAIVRLVDEERGQSKQPFDLQYRLLGNDGSWVWVHDRATPAPGDGDAASPWHGVMLDITEHKHLEASLRDSEARFSRVFEEAGVGMTLGSPDNICLDANAAYCRFVGYPREELIGRPFASLAHPDDWEREEALFARLRGGGIDSYQIEKRYLRPDGTVAFGLLTVAAVRDEAGTFLYDIGQVQDITAQRTAEAALRASEQNLRAIIEQLPAAVYRIDQDSDDYAYVSPRFTALTGIATDPREGSYATYCALVHPDDHPDLQAVDAVATDTGQPLDAEYRVRTPDGSWRWVNDRAMLMRDEQGAPRSWLGVLLDTTERRRLEAALRDQETHLQTIVEHLPAALYRLEPGPDARYSYRSPRFSALTGLPPDQEHVTSDDFRARIHPEDFTTVWQQDREAAQTGAPFSCEYRVQGGDGSWTWVHDRSRLLVDAAGRATAWYGILIDITERKQLEASLQENEARLQAVVARLPAAVYRLEAGAEGRFTYTSPRFAALTGLDPGQEPPRIAAYFARIHPDDVAAVRTADALAGHTGQPFECEFRMQGADGQWRWISDRSVAQLDQAGVPVFWHGVMIDVTERRQMEADLRDKDAHIQVLVEQLPAALYTLEAGETCRYTYLSPQFSAMTGLPLDDAVPGFDAFRARIHPDDAETYDTSNRQALIANQTFEHEYRVRNARGEWTWVHERSVRAPNDQGPGLVWHGVLLDIDERKRLEISLRENEARVQVLVEQMPVALYSKEHGPDGRLTYVSPQLEALLGVTARELEWGLSAPFDRVHPDDRAAVIAAGQHAAASGEPFVCEFRAQKAAGDWTWVHERAVLARDEEGRPRAWHGVMLDMSAQKRLEATVREHEALVKSIFDRAGIGMTLVDLEGTILLANPAMGSLLGYAPEELVGRNVRDFTYPDDMDEQIALRRRQQASEIDTYQMEKRYVRKDGTIIWGLLNVAPVWDEHGVLKAATGQVQDITARKAAEAAFRESESRFRTIFEEAAVGMAMVALEDRMLVANPALARFLGYTLEELVGVSLRDITFADDVPAQLELRRQMRAGEIESYRMEKRYQRKDGAVVWGILNASGVRDAAGSLLAVVAEVQDITARKEAEAAYRESETRFRTIFESAGVGIALTTPESRVIVANPALGDFLGCPPEELVGLRIRDFTYAADYPIQMELRARMLAGEINAYAMEKRYVRLDGEVVWGLINVTAIRDDAGAVTALIGQVQDITARKEAEAALRNSEARFRALVQNDPDVILVINDAQEVVYASPSAEAVFGVPAEELLGPTAPRLANVHPSDLGEALVLLEQLEGVAGATAAMELRLRDQGHEWRWFQLTIANRLAEPSIGGFVCNLRDITERKEAELATAAALQTQQAAIADLEQLNQSKSRFLSTISHEFRTPLTAIIGYSELLSLSPDPKQIAEDAGVIHREANRLNRMVNDVLLVEQLDAGRLHLKLQPLDLNALVREVVDACRPLAAGHGLVLDLDPQLGVVSADSDRLAQALTNLIGNAIKYSSPGEPVTISTRGQGDNAVIAVRDHGIGIAPDDLDRIFDRFERVERGMAGRIAGTGLGLAIARDIAELHGGHLAVESVLGDGSTFTLTVPAVHPAAPGLAGVAAAAVR